MTLGRALSPENEKKCEVKICERGGGGNILPLFGDGEQDWPGALRAPLYLAGLLWLFMGVAIVSDIFMGAIEAITSKKKRVHNAATGHHRTIKVWNDTVANLTLMALGSSAPEILLSVIELLSGEFFSGELGPSCIVGSAAFNLLCISAVCVVSIPNNEVRKVKETSVFAVTAFFSVLAYGWLYLIVVSISKDVVEIWEGVVTFILFPILVVLAYWADKGYFQTARGKDADSAPKVVLGDMSKNDLAALKLRITQQHGDGLTDEQLARLIEKETAAPKSRAAYRVSSTRSIVGGKRVSLPEAKATCPLSSVMPVDISTTSSDLLKNRRACTIDFEAAAYAVLESVGHAELYVRRQGDMDNKACVDYKTRDGSATAPGDYEPVHGTLEFLPGEKQKSITIKIIDDTAYEDDEDFYCDLFNPRITDAEVVGIKLGDMTNTRISIVDDDDPGILSFAEEVMNVSEGTENKTIQAVVKRKDGSNGAVSCKYKTEEGSATKDLDYIHTDGTLHFANGQISACIELTICPRGLYENKEEFRLILTDPVGGIRFDRNMDGGADCNILTVVIESDDDARGRIDRVFQVMQMDWDKAQLGHANWKEQLRDALIVNGGEDHGEPPSAFDWVMHIITVFWKVIFALIPPTDFFGGWVCFSVALVMIGGVTALIGDLAALLGCVLGIPDSITAITLVALGTSLPDTFASKAAAEQDPFADASIGNVTGSNSVNVFLGLGLPWMIGAVYWALVGRTPEWQKKYQDESGFAEWNQGSGKFIVIGGDLGFSVIVFTCVGLVCLFVLLLRRRLFGGELGGPTVAKWATAAFFFLLWCLYIGLSCWKTLQNRKC